jgi:hypothetical protein
MFESINIENKKQRVARIACEILAGAVAGLAVAYPVAYVIGIVLVGKDLSAVFGFQVIFDIVFPPLYGLGSAVGVYLVGSRGKQAGSFLPTLAGGLVGGIVMLVMLPFALFLSSDYIVEVESSDYIVGVEKIVGWALVVLISLIPPIFATIGFNLRRRYKEPPSA